MKGSPMNKMNFLNLLAIASISIGSTVLNCSEPPRHPQGVSIQIINKYPQAFILEFMKQGDIHLGFSRIYAGQNTCPFEQMVKVPLIPLTIKFYTLDDRQTCKLAEQKLIIEDLKNIASIAIINANTAKVHYRGRHAEEISF